MRRILQYFSYRTEFNDTAAIHHRYFVGNLGYHSQVVSHKNHCHFQPCLELSYQSQDLGLHCDIQRG